MLLLSPENKLKVDQVLQFAEKRENWFFPGKSTFVPGDISGYVVYIDSFRCVFSFTVDSGRRIFRHMSISVPGTGYPNPVAVYTLASWMGFTGGIQSQDSPEVIIAPAKDWVLRMEPEDRCIVVVQEINKGRLL